jgi:hypothetical protein
MPFSLDDVPSSCLFHLDWDELMFNQCRYGKLCELVTMAALFRARRSVAMAKHKNRKRKIFQDERFDVLLASVRRD